jgi:hypothetical protein
LPSNRQIAENARYQIDKRQSGVHGKRGHLAHKKSSFQSYLLLEIQALMLSMFGVCFLGKIANRIAYVAVLMPCGVHTHWDMMNVQVTSVTSDPCARHFIQPEFDQLLMLHTGVLC